jgi:hypothetical protein
MGRHPVLATQIERGRDRALAGHDQLNLIRVAH